ncbi:MAG TPA: CoA-transferase [Bacillota bacterium]|nr:CoA-transferase [Bacillota bacterium]
MENYTIEELLAVEVSKHLNNDEMGFVGVGTGGKAYIRAVGIPAVASRLAQLSHAPDYMIMFGPIIDPMLDSECIPETNFEYDLIHWPCRSQITVYDSHVVFKAGRMGVGFVSGVQVDKFGNTNIVCIGDYNKPKVRLPGSLAQPDHFAFAKRVFAIVKHDKRTFVEHVDYISGCGHENRDGLKGGGPAFIFTELCVMDFNEQGRMRLKSIHPGVTLQEVIDNTGFKLDIPENVPFTEAPTELELKLIRERIDPKRKWLNATITLEPATLAD